MNKLLERRYNRTVSFMSEHINSSESILDLGVSNALSNLILMNGFNVSNTHGEDLDIENDIETKYGRFDVVTAFEILEHLVSPFELLKRLPSNKLIATVPLRLWFAKAYKSNSNPRDRHYHEFEDWQFDWLLIKSGWEIKAREKWMGKSDKIGIRPFLRYITPRFYAVYAERTGC